MADAARRLWTYETYRELPEDGKRRQIIEGELFVTPAPGSYHQTLSKRLQYELYRHVELEGRGQFFNAPIDVIFDDRSVLQPDLVVILEGGKARVTAEGIHGPPDLLVEILSPSTARTDRQAKRTLYAGHGVREYWIVDPDATRIEVASNPDEAFAKPVIFDAPETLRSRVLPDLCIALRPLFAPSD